MNPLIISGFVFAGTTILTAGFLFGYLVVKQEKLKKLPIWFYILAILGFLMGLAAIGLILGGYAQKGAFSGESSIRILIEYLY